MCSHNFLFRQASLVLQGVNVLCEAAQQQALVMQQLHEEVCRCWLKRPWEQLLHVPHQCIMLSCCCSSQGLGSYNPGGNELKGTVFDAECSARTVLKYGTCIKISQTLYFSKMREQPGNPQMLQDMPS